MLLLEYPSLDDVAINMYFPIANQFHVHEIIS
jgi:hypothetical protein